MKISVKRNGRGGGHIDRLLTVAAKNNDRRREPDRGKRSDRPGTGPVRFPGILFITFISAALTFFRRNTLKVSSAFERERTSAVSGIQGPGPSSTKSIIALTPNAFDKNVQRSMQAGLNAHLSKPVEPAAPFETPE